MKTDERKAPEAAMNGPKYALDIEGTLHPWDSETITTEQIIALGGWDPQLGVIEIDKDNNERTLQPGEVVQLRPGLGFSKKVQWKRGDALAQRIEEELGLLRNRFPGVEYSNRWVRLPSYPLPPGWSLGWTPVAFHMRDGFPGIGPYGIYVPAGLRFQDKLPSNYSEPAGSQPPFGGNWGVFSWEAEGWFAKADIRAGHNLLTWTEGIIKRFKEGQ